MAPRRLSCHISANQCEVETSANVNKHWITRAKGNDVITKVISANQHFASTIFQCRYSNSRDVVASSLSGFSRPAARGPRRPCNCSRATSSNFCRFFYCPISCSSPSWFNDSLRTKANYCSSFYHEKQFYISRPPCFASHAFYSRQKRYNVIGVNLLHFTLMDSLKKMDNLVPSVLYRRNLMSRTKLLDNSDWFENELKCRENFFWGKGLPSYLRIWRSPHLLT